MSLNQPSVSKPHHRAQYAIVAAALVGGVAGVITFMLMAMVFMFASVQTGHSFALYTGQLHLANLIMPHGTLDGAAWLLVIATYVSLLISLPAFVILYLGEDDAQ